MRSRLRDAGAERELASEVCAAAAADSSGVRHERWEGSGHRWLADSGLAGELVSGDVQSVVGRLGQGERGGLVVVSASPDREQRRRFLAAFWWRGSDR